LPSNQRAIFETPLLRVLIISALVALAICYLSVQTSMSISWSNAEAWQDYSLAYVQAANYLKSGILPYANYFYAYPPPFLYALTAFSLIPYSWGAAVPLVSASVLTAVPVFLVGRRVFGERVAVTAASLTVFAPISLFYSDYLWLNPALTTLFLMLSIYFLLEGRLDLSGLLLALSIGFKQTALVALPIILIYVLRKTNRRAALRYLLLVAGIAVVYSLPYVVVVPKFYLFSFFRIPTQFWGSLQGYYFGLGFPGPVPPLPGSYVATLQGIETVWNLFANPNSAASLVLSTMVLFLPNAPASAYPLAELSMNLVLVLGYLSLLLVLYRRSGIDESTLLRYLMYGMLLLFALYPVYKYYLVGVVPFLALFSQDRKSVTAFMGFNLVLLAIPRVATPYLVLGLFLWMTSHDIGPALYRGFRKGSLRLREPGTHVRLWLERKRLALLASNQVSC
jgi:hypothetical protein